MDDPRRATWAGFGAALSFTAFAVGAGVYTGGRNGFTVNSSHQLTPAGNLPLWNGFLILCYVLFVLGGYCVAAALAHMRWLPLPGVSRAEGLRKAPPLVVDFDASDLLCVQDRQRELDIQIRLRVSNVGPVGVNGVRLRLVERSPDIAHVFYLAMMHDRTPFSRSAISGERCPSGGDRFIYFDLVYWSRRRLPSSPPPRPVVSYADDYLVVEQQTHTEPIRSQEITVEADGYWEDDHTSVTPRRRSFHIEYADDGGIALTAAASPPRAATLTPPATGSAHG